MAMSGTTPEGPANFYLISDRHFFDEEWRDFSVGHSLHCQLEATGPVSRGDRVATFSAVAALGGQSHIHVLTWQVPGPGGSTEGESSSAGGFAPGIHEFGSLPQQ